MALQAQSQPATTVLAVALAALFPALLRRDVGLSYSAVVEHREVWRCFVAQLAHVDLIHLAFNLSALWSIGIVERTQGLGVLYYLRTTVLLLLLSPAVRAAAPRNAVGLKGLCTGVWFGPHPACSRSGCSHPCWPQHHTTHPIPSQPCR